MENRSNKRRGMYTATLFGMLSALSLVYSCNADDETNYTKTETEESSTFRTRCFISSIPSSGNILIDSVANSDELYEFERSTEQLADKFGAYTDHLSDQEYDKFMENMNDEEFVKDLIKKAELEEVLRRVSEAPKGLLERTVFLRLSDDEQKLLFKLQIERNNSIINRKFLKTREEGNKTSKCEELRQAAYDQARQDYDHAIATNCKNTGPFSPCRAKEAMIYRAILRIANQEYESCINAQ